MRFSTRSTGEPVRRLIGVLAIVLGVLFVLKTLPAWFWLVAAGIGLIAAGWRVLK